MAEASVDLAEYQKEQVVPLTDWKNEPTCVDLKKDYQEANGHHDNHVSKVNVWLDNLNVTGSAVIAKVKGRSTVVPKLIRKQAEWRYAALSEPFLSQEDMYQTEPLTWEDKDAAVQNGLVLNNQWNTQLDKVNFVDEYVRTAVDEGTVVVRTGWEFEEEEVEVPNMVPTPVTEPFHAQMLTQAVQMVMENPEGAEELPPELIEEVELSMQHRQPMTLVQNGLRKEMQTLLNQPTIEVCDYNAIIIDPTCKGNLKKASFIIFRFETSMSDLEKSSVDYQNLDNINIEGNTTQTLDAGSSQEEDTNEFQFTDKPRKKFYAYEYWGFWDIDDSGMTKPIVGTWVGDTLIRMEESPFPDQGLPFVKIQYLPKRKHVYGEPDGELLEDNQKISGAVTRGMLDILGRSAAGQTGIRKDALDVTNQRKFDKGMDYSFNAQIDPRLAFHTNVYPEIPNSAQFMLQLQNMEAESMTGVKAYGNTGISGDGLGKVATGVRGALDAASKRELGILRRLATGIIEIGRKITAMNAVFLSEEEVVRITNDEFVTVKRDDLAGKIDIRLSISTAETDNAKAEELAFMLQTNGPNSDPGEVRMIRAEIARLRKMPALAKRIEEYQPEPTPLEQAQVQREMKEIEKIDAEIIKLLSEAEENNAEAQLDTARARKEHSTADKQDLDFVEQETGVTHQRDTEVIGTQAEGNKELEVLKSVLNEGGNAAGNGTTPHS